MARKCNARESGYVCDRPAGHLGDHRQTAKTMKELDVFWSPRKKR